MTTKALADFVASVQYDKLSPETVRITKQCILDWLGVCIRGSQEKPIQIIRKLLLDGGGKAQGQAREQVPGHGDGHCWGRTRKCGRMLPVGCRWKLPRVTGALRALRVRQGRITSSPPRRGWDPNW